MKGGIGEGRLCKRREMDRWSDQKYEQTGGEQVRGWIDGGP